MQSENVPNAKSNQKKTFVSQSSEITQATCSLTFSISFSLKLREMQGKVNQASSQFLSVFFAAVSWSLLSFYSMDPIQMNINHLASLPNPQGLNKYIFYSLLRFKTLRTKENTLLSHLFWLSLILFKSGCVCGGYVCVFEKSIQRLCFLRKLALD